MAQNNTPPQNPGSQAEVLIDKQSKLQEVFDKLSDDKARKYQSEYDRLSVLQSSSIVDQMRATSQIDQFIKQMSRELPGDSNSAQGTQETFIESIKSDLKSATNHPFIQNAISSLSKIQLGNISDTQVKDEIEDILSQIKTIDLDTAQSKALGLVKEAQKIYNEYLGEREEVEASIKDAKDAIISNEFLDNNDFFDFTWKAISSKLEEAESLGVQKIINRANKIDIKSAKITSEDWDEFFDDLRDDVPSDRLSVFEKEILKFKKENVLYKGDLAGGATSISGKIIAEVGDFIQVDKVIDKDLDINSIGIYLKDTLNTLTPNKEGNYAFNILGLEAEFSTQKGAALFLYKMLLILDELEKGDHSFLGILGGVLGFAGDIGGGLLDITSAAWEAHGLLAALEGFILVGLFRSATRNAKDVVSISFGKKVPSDGLLTRSTPSEHTGLKRFINPIHYQKAIRHWVYKTLKAGHDAHQDPFARDLDINIFDSFNDNANETYEDTKTKQKVLDYYEKKFAHNQDVLDELNKLKKTEKFFFGGELSTESKTFWIKVHQITNKHSKLKKGANLIYLDYSNIKQIVLNDLNTGLKRAQQGLSVLYDIPSSGEGSPDLETVKKTPFHNRVAANIDLGNFGDEELAKEGLFKELIKDTRNVELHYSKAEIRQEIARIINGYLPRFKIQKILGSEIASETSSAVRSRLQTFLDNIEKGNWIGTQLELETAISENRSGHFVYSDNKVTYTDAEITDMENKGKELLRHKFDAEKVSLSNGEKITNSAGFQRYLEVEVEIQKMVHNLDSIEPINDELDKLYQTMVPDVEGIKNDYTKGQLNFLSGVIIAGESLDDAQAKLALLSDADISHLDIPAENKENLRKLKRQNLIHSMQTDLTAIAGEADPIENDRLLRDYKTRYVSMIDDNPDLKKFIEGAGTNYRRVEKQYNELTGKLRLKLTEFVSIENNRITGQADELLQAADKIDTSKKTELKILRDYITANPDRKVSLIQLENTIKAVIVGDIKKENIGAINFGLYDDDRVLSSGAQELRIVSPKDVSIYNADTANRSTEKISSVEEAKFESIVHKWNSFMDGRHDIQLLAQNTREISDIGTQISDLDARITVSQSTISIPGRVQEDTTLLQAEKKTLTDKLGKLESARNSLRTAPQYKTMSADQIDAKLIADEQAFLKHLDKNPGFMDYAMRQGIDPSQMGAEDLWRGFMAYADTNTVKADKVFAAPIVRTAPIGPSTGPEALRQQAFDRIGKLAPMMDRVIGKNKFDSMRHVNEIMGSTVTDVDKFITDILKQYALADGKPIDAKVLRDEFIDKSNLSPANKLTIQTELKTKSMTNLDAKFKSQAWYKNMPDFLDRMARAI